MNLARAAKGPRASFKSALPDVVAILLGISLLAVFALTFAISPLNGEDYALTMRPDGMNLLQRLFWVVGRSHTQVKEWNARLGEQLAILWLIQPRFLFVAVNTLAFVAFCVLLATLAIAPAAVDRRLLHACLMACAVCFLLWPRMEIFFWSTAAAGYLHPLTLTLAFILPFRLPQVRRALETSWGGFLAWCVFGFAAGLSFENLPPALLAYCAFEVLLLMRSKESVSLRQMVVPLCFYAVGWVVLITADSTRMRADWYRGHLDATQGDRLGDTVGSFWNTGWGLLLAFAVLAVLALMNRHRRSLLPSRGLALLGAGLLSALFLVFAPYTEPRAFTLLWVAMIALIVNWLTSPAFVKQLAVPVLLAMSIAALLEGARAWIEYSAFARAVDARAQYVSSRRGSDACRTGLPISLIPATPDPRLLNNREEWVGGFLDQVGHYFGCKLTVR